MKIDGINTCYQAKMYTEYSIRSIDFAISWKGFFMKIMNPRLINHIESNFLFTQKYKSLQKKKVFNEMTTKQQATYADIYIKSRRNMFMVTKKFNRTWKIHTWRCDDKKEEEELK